MPQRRLFPSNGILIVSLLMFAACNKYEGTLPKTATENPSTPPQATVNNDTSSQAGDPMQTERAAFVQHAREDIDKLKIRLSQLKTKAQHSLAEKPRLEKDIAGIEDHLTNMEKMLADLKTTSASAWQEMKTRFSTALENLKSMLDKSNDA